MSPQKYNQKGTLLILVLVFGSIFLTIAVSFMGFVVTQSRTQDMKHNDEQALAIAEAGLDYYKWYLAHNPDDTTHGTGSPGPYVIPYENAAASTTIGEFSLEIASTTYCGVGSSIDITSTGYTDEEPQRKRVVYGKYARPTVAEYAYIINSNVWAGADRTIIGPYHSNGGIRMDGTNNSTVTSGQETWTCTSSFGCSPNQTVDGVFGSGPNGSLWTFPSTPINFTGLTVDLALMKDRAQNGGGIYITNSGVFGYRVQYNADDTIDVYPVTNTESYTAYNNSDGDHTERNIIISEGPPTNYALNPDCPLVFIEDNVWLHGTTSMRSSIAAADTDVGGGDYSIVLHNNMVYNNDDAGILAVAEDDVLVGLVVPDDMSLNGIFVAQSGRFGRNHYEEGDLPRTCLWWWWFCTSWDEPYAQYVTRNSLPMNGTIVSNGRVGTKWSSGGVFVSGFNTRYNSYDRDLVDNPPPLAPKTSDDYKFIEWREVE